jgi:hypothetical protein
MTMATGLHWFRLQPRPGYAPGWRCYLTTRHHVDIRACGADGTGPFVATEYLHLVAGTPRSFLTLQAAQDWVASWPE